MKASLGSCQGGAPLVLHSQADDRAVSRGTEVHLCNLHRPREGLRPSPEGGDLENHEGEAGTRKICQAGPRHVHWMPNEGAHSRGRKQQIQWRGWPTPGICLKGALYRISPPRGASI